MVEEQQKEQFSKAYVHAIASVAGYKFDTPDVDDDSVDVTLASSGDRGTTKRPKIDAQLKCSSQDILLPDGVHFALPIKNYDDLRAEVLVPRILIVVLVPEGVENWIEQDQSRLIIYKCAYWVSLRGKPDVPNSSSITVTLPKENILTPSSLAQMMAKIDRDKML